MPLKACPKCQHRFYQIMDQSSEQSGKLATKEHYVMCSSCGTLLGKFHEDENTQ
jgi:phage terminase large subunit GpA-like protein